MKVTNKSPRLVFVPTPTGLLRIAPLQELMIDASDEAAVLASLSGPLRALVDAGEIEIDPPLPTTSPGEAVAAPAPTSSAAPATTSSSRRR